MRTECPAPRILPLVHLPLSTSPTLPSYRDLFGDRCYLLAELHRGPDDRRRVGSGWWNCRGRRGIPLVAAGDVHYHVPERAALHDVLTAIRHGCTVADGDRASVSQCRAAPEIARGNGRALRRRARGRCAARWKSPSAARFRSTSCATSIPRNWPRRA